MGGPGCPCGIITGPEVVCIVRTVKNCFSTGVEVNNGLAQLGVTVVVVVEGYRKLLDFFNERRFLSLIVQMVEKEKCCTMFQVVVIPLDEQELDISQ